jgi:transposase
LDVKTLLNRCHRMPRFVYGRAYFVDGHIVVPVRPRRGSKPVCPHCDLPGPSYDKARDDRLFEFIPLWGIQVFLCYAMRRVSCVRCATVVVERVPWAEGKNQTCHAYRIFLARWAKRLSWSQVAEIFRTNFGVVHRAVAWVVAFGLATRSLDDIQAIGVDEIAVRKGHQYMTVVYQIDARFRRLLWVGRERTEESFTQFFTMLGKTRSKAIRYIASDMWRPYLNVIARYAAEAVHVLDRFHIVAKVNKAIDEIRAGEARHLAGNGFAPILKHTRWCFLKKRRNLTLRQRTTLNDVLRYDLRSVRAYLHKEALDALWCYKSERWAGWFLDKWCARVMRSRLEPLKKIARSLRTHRPLILNWFKAHGELSSAAVEGMNLNAKLAIRKARGFRTHEVLETALYHQLAHLPEPPETHRFC